MTDTVADHVMSWDLLVLRCEQEARCWDAWCADDGRPAHALRTIRAYQTSPAESVDLQPATLAVLQAAQMAWQADPHLDNTKLSIRTAPIRIAMLYAETIYRLLLALQARFAVDAEKYRRAAQRSFEAMIIYAAITHPEWWGEDTP